MPVMTAALFSRTEHGSTPDTNALGNAPSSSLRQIHAELPMDAGRRDSGAARRAHAVCSMSASGEAVSALRAFAQDTAEHWGIPEDAVYTLRVAVSELVTNAVLHSGSADVELAMHLSGATAIIRVKDSGTWTPPEPSAKDRHEEDEVHGRGLHIVRAYATRCTVESSSRGTEVRAEIDVSASAPQFFEYGTGLVPSGTL